MANEHDGPMTPLPYAGYLTDVSWGDALDHIERVAEAHPELAPSLLQWLVRETRRAMLDELPPHGPDAGWFQKTSATWAARTGAGDIDVLFE